MKRGLALRWWTLDPAAAHGQQLQQARAFSQNFHTNIPLSFLLKRFLFIRLETIACTMDKVNIDSNFEEGVRLINRPNPLPCALLGGEPYSEVQYCMLCCIFRPEQSFVNPVVQCNVIKCWYCAFD